MACRMLRSFLLKFERNSAFGHLNCFNQNFIAISRIPIRHASFLSSDKVENLEDYPDVEIVHNPPEWKYVERLLAPAIVPKPIEKPEYPSGWKPQSPITENRKYFVSRTMNHMIPVYLQKKYRGMRQITKIRLIDGDIWTLEKELRAIIEKARNGRICASRVNELSGQIEFHGNYVDIVREYLKKNGL